MIYMSHFCLLLSTSLSVFTLLSTLASANDVDVDRIAAEARAVDAVQYLNQKLLEQRGVNNRLRRECTRVKVGRECWETGSEYGSGQICEDEYENKCKIVRGALKVSSATTTDPEMHFGEQERDVIPSQLIVENANIFNCSASQQSFTRTFTLVATEQTRIENTRTVQRARNNTMKLTTSFKVLDIGVGTAGTLAINKTTTIRNSEIQTDTKQITRATALPVKIGEFTRLYVELKIAEHNLRQAYAGRMLVDGPLDSNLEGYARASEILSESEREVFAAGWIRATLAGSLDISFQEAKLDQGSCGVATAVDLERFPNALNLFGIHTGVGF